jgi:hypothetical protein
MIERSTPFNMRFVFFLSMNQGFCQAGKRDGGDSLIISVEKDENPGDFKT